MTNVKNMRFVDVKDFIHLGGTSDEIVEKFAQLVTSGIVDIKNIKLITIKYDTSTGEVEKGPVRIYCLNGLAIQLNLTAGYGGSGPSDLCKVLELCEINFDKDDILTKQDVVDLKYIVEPDMCYQFHNMDGTFEYSM